MNRGLYTAAAGMMTMLSRVQMISNNLANANTPGYREDLLRLSTFPQQLTARLFSDGHVQQIGALGNGVTSESVVTRFVQASFKPTDSPLDVAIQGEGFFSVQTPQGLRYTRDGSFRRDGNNQLVTNQGDLVLSPAGTPINVAPGLVTILPTGEIRVDDQPAGQIAITEFQEAGQLKKLGNNLFEDLENRAGAQPSPTSNVYQGYLELSNVDPVRAMADIMASQRSYEASSRMMQLLDEMTSRAVGDVGRV